MLLRLSKAAEFLDKEATETLPTQTPANGLEGRIQRKGPGLIFQKRKKIEGPRAYAPRFSVNSAAMPRQ